jgi:hypothetical protein
VAGGLEATKVVVNQFVRWRWTVVRRGVQIAPTFIN